MKIDVEIYKCIDSWACAAASHSKDAEEECLKTSIDIIDEDIIDFQSIVNYEISPESFFVKKFVLENIKAIHAALTMACGAFGIKLGSPYNIDGILGFVLSFERTSLKIDIPYACAQDIFFYSTVLWKHPRICKKKEDEPYAVWQHRYEIEEDIVNFSHL